jgi:NAD(P)-dependent dehydrogenase (short-subunit alcohol dehydrogenase family)
MFLRVKCGKEVLLLSDLVKNKIALITGGSSGMGRAASLIFAREGAVVVIADINVAGGQETVKMVKAAGGEAAFIKTDVRMAHEVASLVDEIVKKYGRLDCAYNNAGVFSWFEPGKADPDPEETWSRVVDTNMKGVWQCMRYEIQQMRQQGKGAIVNTASVHGLIGDENENYAYCASKHGVIGLTRTAALVQAKNGIRVNAVCPGSTATPMAGVPYPCPSDFSSTAAEIDRRKMEERLIPMGRWARPTEIPEAAVWLCSDAASYVTGHIMVIDGGKTVGRFFPE